MLFREKMYISGHFSQINDPALSEELELLLANILGRVHFGFYHSFVSWNYLLMLFLLQQHVWFINKG